MPGSRIYQEALRIHHQPQYRFCDSLIVAAALEAGVTTLYPKDLQHKRINGNLLIANSFLE